jgi:selenocysteine lyase/cysteine desulfurase
MDREESGTPDILGSLRAGLAIQVKSRLGARLIQAAEERLVSRVMCALTVC